MSNRVLMVHGFTLVIGLLGMGLSGCGSKDAPDASINADRDTEGQSDLAGKTDQAGQLGGPVRSQLPKKNLRPRIRLETTLGTMILELNAEKAPLTVSNFIENYVDTGFYNGVIFHHVDSGSIAASGGYSQDLKQIPLRGDILNEADNGLQNVRGTIAMARHPEARNSSNSQFWINLADNPMFDHKDDQSDEAFGYCVFGKVVEGLEILDKIAAVQTVAKGDFPMMPVNPVVILSAKRTE